MNTRLKRIAISVLLLAQGGCMSAGSDETADSAEPPMASAHGEKLPESQPDSGIAQALRTVVVYLSADPGVGFVPEYQGRSLTVSLIAQQTRTAATGLLNTDGIETYVIGASCASLRTRYPQMISCEITEMLQNGQGLVAARATTDQEGFVSFAVEQHIEYRLNLQSWVTQEDDKCFWGGTAVLPAQITSLEMPLHVFCE